MTDSAPAADGQRRVASLPGLALIFLRLGSTALGGPAVHIAMMEAEFVGRRKLLTRDEFLDMLGAANLMPGPTSTELGMQIGLRLGGAAGLVTAGFCFILPAACLVTLIAWIYVRYGHLPQAIRILRGVKPVVIAVVVQALCNVWRTAVKGRLLAGLWASAVLVFAVGAAPFSVLFAAGTLSLGAGAVHTRRRGSALLVIAMAVITAALFGLPALLPHGILPAGALSRPGPASLFTYFLRVGAVLYGSGYVLVAFIRHDLVSRMKWITAPQLLDAVAVGQVTPGPVFTTATFIGFLTGGFPGAVTATTGIFLPAFVFAGIAGRVVAKVRQAPLAASFLDGVNAAAVALMAVVTVQLGRAAIVDAATAVLALVSALLLIRYRVNAFWLVLGAALVEILMMAIGLR